MPRIPDNFFLGLFLGAGLLSGGAALVQQLRNSFAEVPRYWQEPKPELLFLVINLVVFRLLVVKANYERMGRGVLMATILLVLIYQFGRMRSATV